MKYILKALSALRDFLFLATRHWISAIGVVLASIASISFLVILAMELGGVELGNYNGLISYLVLPALFVVGLVLIPIGIRIVRRRERAGEVTTYPVLNFNDPRFRSIALLVLALSVANLMIVSTATYKGLEVMHSDAFCGGTCHNVMQPEAVAHQITPHGNVHCADCHIGEGVAHFTRAKLNGATQGVQFLLGDYSRPIPQPTVVPNQICIRCHATDRFTESRLHIRKTFDDGEKTSP
ncbi:MAG TPA: NapC/NirT family cytochrome c, partial [Myxococcaceae bacterium]|nr:NapC/NirT family cytochrome c [Myxococcaceae bacterium]